MCVCTVRGQINPPYELGHDTCMYKIVDMYTVEPLALGPTSNTHDV